MRIVQVPLWWSLALGVGVFIASIDGDMAAAITFASVFGFIFGGHMQVIRKTQPRPVLVRKSHRRKHS